MPLKIIPKRIKYLGINFTNKVKNLYSENCKALIKEIEDDTKKWKYIHAIKPKELIEKWPYYT